MNSKFQFIHELEFGIFFVTLYYLILLINKKAMKKYEVITLKKAMSFGSMKEELSKEVEQFLNKKVNEGYEIVDVSFSYYEAQELIAFITICR